MKNSSVFKKGQIMQTVNTENFTDFIQHALGHFDEVKLKISSIADSASSYDGKVSETVYYYFNDGKQKGGRFQITIRQINGDEENEQDE
jgi:hypothetical protein